MPASSDAGSRNLRRSIGMAASGLHLAMIQRIESTGVELIAHRGMWGHGCAANTLEAFRRALVRGYGLETDIRDRGGQLVISHDPPGDRDVPTLPDLLALYTRTGARSRLALNVKADGLASRVWQLTRDYGVENYFVFDMSVPDALQYARHRLPFFTRQSEFEPAPPLYDDAEGVWLDAFGRDWFNTGMVQRHLDRGKSVCIVSPELHGRPFQQVWQLATQVADGPSVRVMLCTDHPGQFEVEYAN